MGIIFKTKNVEAKNLFLKNREHYIRIILSSFLLPVQNLGGRHLPSLPDASCGPTDK